MKNNVSKASKLSRARVHWSPTPHPETTKALQVQRGAHLRQDLHPLAQDARDVSDEAPVLADPGLDVELLQQGTHAGPAPPGTRQLHHPISSSGSDRTAQFGIHLVLFISLINELLIHGEPGND